MKEIAMLSHLFSQLLILSFLNVVVDDLSDKQKRVCVIILRTYVLSIHQS